ncbi:MAG: recombinase RmuC [Deltaproteobacteria bacterium RBG_13_49_15]|nr:MAG: recombinase RmuC [Deltaproteobacteria bacterium RBG_13_49_15]
MTAEFLFSVSVWMFVGVMILLFAAVLGRIKQGNIKLNESITALKREFEDTERMVKDEISRNRQEMAEGGVGARREFSRSLMEFSDSVLMRMTEHAGMQKNQLDSFARLLSEMTRINEEKLDSMRKTMEENLRRLQEENSQKLEQMRQTVDEKLQSSLEKRLSESFKQVSDRLDQVYKGFGEMRNLAIGVGDLKKVLTNVKTRGIWGEIQLGNILEQILTSDQYDVNVATKTNGLERVEFAVRLPGRDNQRGNVVYLPIDSKFPQEDYQRLLDAQDRADKADVEFYTKSLESRIKNEAKAIREKYIDPPNTTDFAILFLPVEGLYAEVLRRPGLCEILQREYRVMICGPTTLAAMLNSLQMGFRTLAIEKRSSEVWEILGMVKTEFGKFGEILAKTKKKLQEAGDTIEQAEVRTRAIEKKLKDVQELPSGSLSC